MRRVSQIATIDKMVHGGFALGTLENGKKAFVWGALPGERVMFVVTKKHSGYVEGVTEKVLKPSDLRVAPKDDGYLSTSPWQIMRYSQENEYKKSILQETFRREGVDIPQISFHAPRREWGYRNKMEYSFYGDDEGLHLALYGRGSHNKRIVSGSSIARREIDLVARQVCELLNAQRVRASSLKTIMLRCAANGEVACVLFVKDKEFIKLPDLKNLCKGSAVCYSDPKSPASVRTKDLYMYGDISLTDSIRGTKISYDVFSFFQVNLDIFEQVISRIDREVSGKGVIDLYGGVGTIGLSVSGNVKKIIDSDSANIRWARLNAKGSVSVVSAKAEDAIEHINNVDIVTVDPPRAGLHRKIIEKFAKEKPPKIVYLSCNPSTQARDIKLLERSHKLESLEGYNFFPKTPHIESLAILTRV